MRRTLLLVVGVAVLALAGCDARPTASQRSTTKVTLTPPPDPPGDGRFYALVGPTALAADVYEMRFSALRFERLTTDARVSTLSGCGQRLVVAAAQREVGYADRLQEFRDGKLQPVDGLGMPPASNPALNADCRTLYYEQSKAGTSLIGNVKLWDPAKGAPTVLVTGDPDLLAGATWGPNGAVAVLWREPKGARVMVIRPDGTRYDVDPQMANAGNLQWGQTGWLALGDFTPKFEEIGAVFINPETKARTSLPGWAPLAWSPDGAHLLMVNVTDHTRLGVAEPANLTAVRDVGSSTAGPIWGAVWLPA